MLTFQLYLQNKPTSVISEYCTDRIHVVNNHHHIIIAVVKEIQQKNNNFLMCHFYNIPCACLYSTVA